MRGRTAVVPSPSRAVLLRGRIAFAWVCGMALLAVSGCGASGKQTLRLGNGDAGRRLIAAVGDTIEVTLQDRAPVVAGPDRLEGYLDRVAACRYQPSSGISVAQA